MRATDLTEAVWHKSSYSLANSDCVEVAWHKSSYSSANSNCVEVGFGGELVAARDSKNPGGPVLVFAPAGWAAFVRGVRRP